MFRKPKRKIYFLIFVLPTLAAFLIGFVYPFFNGIYLSFCKFRTTSDAVFIGFGNYVKAFQNEGFLHSFWFTVLFVIVSVILINLIAFFVAYALTLGIRGSNVFRTVFFVPNLVGGIILGYIWQYIFNGILQYYGTNLALNANYGFWGLVILMCWQQAGYMMIIYIAGLQAVPGELIEAAKIDGSGRVGIFFRVILPLVKPALATSAIFSFYWKWEELIGPMLYLNKPETYTVSLALKQFLDSSSSSNWGAMFAMSVVSLIPVLIIFFMFQKYIVEGISTTGLK